MRYFGGVIKFFRNHFRQLSRCIGHFIANQNNSLRTRGNYVSSQRFMIDLCLVTKFAHRTKQNHFFAAAAFTRELTQSGFHRDGIGVVTLVNQQRLANI